MTDELSKKAVDTINLPEAPASATVKVRSPLGFDWLVTTRSLSMSDVMGRMEFIEDWLLNHNWQPATNAYKPGAASPAPTANGSGGVAGQTCPHHGNQLKQSKHNDNQWYCPKMVAEQASGKKIYCDYKVTA